eukprot:TRINITY_DN2454_c0_g1_i1.p2 TRINITY_DN2454_c0_g1~~TRINITY_DN2454_c0_g1_i1.p2  ORF type:complete len:153 (-),score=38.02 TRINITY_DN2454_c0_g1_i1:243-701(-)
MSYYNLKPKSSPSRAARINRPNDYNGPMLQVNLYRASGLPSADRNGLSDPFVDISLGGWRARSKVIRKTLNPTWNAFFLFPFDTPGSTVELQDAVVEFQIYDKDSLGKQLLGTVHVALSEFLNAGDKKEIRLKKRLQGATGKLTFGLKLHNY